MKTKLRLLGAVLRIANSELEKGCPNITEDELDDIIDVMNRTFAPTKEKPIGMYGLKSMLGLERETIQREIKDGLLPKGFQVPGTGNINFWFKSEIKKAQTK